MCKKIIVMLLVICMMATFTACSNKPNDESAASDSTASDSTAQPSNDNGESVEETDSQESIQEGELRHVSEMLARFGTQDGFYFIKSYHPADKMEEGYDNIMYIDYATGKQVYLCNKSNCSHSDSSCTSYLPINGAQGLFTYKDKLYRLSDAYSSDGKMEVPGLFVSDLDGSNQKMLYEMDSGMGWLRDFVIGEGVLYADVMVMEEEDSEGGFVFFGGDDSNSRLLSIDLSTGKTEIVHDLTNKKIAGVFGDYIVISEPKNGEMVFSLFDTASNAASEVGRIKGTAIYAYSDGKVYYAIDNTLHTLDLQSGTTSQIASGLTASPDTIQIYNGFAVCEKSDENGTQAHFAVDLASGTVTQINLFKSGLDFKIPVEIEAEWGEYFLVCLGYKIDEEYVDWVGVWQEYISEEHFALIKKQDFFAGEAEYQTIQE